MEVSEHVQALVYTNVNDVIFHLAVVGDRYRFLQINSAFTRATGLAAEQVVGRFVDEVIPEPSLSLVLANYRKAIAERHTVRWEEVTEYPSGTKVGEVSVTPVFDQSGRCIQLVGTVCDATALRAQHELIRRYADLVREVQIALSVWGVGALDDLDSIRLAASNPEASKLTGVDLAAGVGKPILELLPFLRGQPLITTILEVARDHVVRDMTPYPSAVHPSRMLSVKVFPVADRSVGIAIQDITASYRAERLQAGERQALELLASDAPTIAILTSIVRMIEALETDTIASILLLDETGSHLRHGAAPSLPVAYNLAIDGAPISEKGGSCGTAAFRGEPVHVKDVLTDPLWEDYRDLAKLIGMRACWSTPIKSNDGRVLGTFALYHREPKLPEPHVLDLIGHATHVAAIVLERRLLDEQLRALPARMEAVREEERTGIARELHDELGQALTALKMDIAWIGRRIHDSTEVATKLVEMSMMTDGVIQSVRRISAELRPDILDDLGLLAAIEWQADEFATRTGVSCTVEHDLGNLRVERALATAVFRIYQEALTNITRYANAKNVGVSLRREGNTLLLEVADDGVGIAPAATRGSSLGLLGMRERARRLGGDCTVERREPRAGTLVTLTVPLDDP